LTQRCFNYENQFIDFPHVTDDGLEDGGRATEWFLEELVLKMYIVSLVEENAELLPDTVC
jgi:hypothetical protein